MAKNFAPLLIMLCNFAHAQDLQLMNAFKQGQVEGPGNCASVAMIKAAIDRYGVGNVFMRIRDEASRTYFVRLYSGVALTLTYDEIEKAAKEAGFIESKYPEMQTVKLYADTCFAVMAKHLQMVEALHDDGVKYDQFEDAIKDLNNGYSSTNVSALLGLNTTVVKKKSEMRQKSGVVIYNKSHAAYASYGQYDEASDRTGTPIGKFHWKYKCLSCGIFFCGIQAFVVDYKSELLSKR